MFVIVHFSECTCAESSLVLTEHVALRLIVQSICQPFVKYQSCTLGASVIRQLIQLDGLHI